MLSRHSVGTYQVKPAHMQLVRKHSATVVSACWATVDWFWPKKLELVVQADLHFLKKKNVQVGNELSKRKNPPKFLQLMKKPQL